MTSESLNYESLTNDAILEIFQNAILNNVKKKYHEKIKKGSPLKSTYLKIESDPEPYTRRSIEPILHKFFPQIEFGAEIHKKTSLGNLRKPDGFIESTDKDINNNILIEWEPYNEDLRAKREHGINQAKMWISDINIGKYNDALVTNGSQWIFITTQEINDEIHVVENDLTIKDALKLMDNVYRGERINKPSIYEAINITDKFYNWYVSLIHGGEYIDKENKKRIIHKDECLINNVLNATKKEEKESFIRVNFIRLIFIRILTEYGIITEDILNYIKNSKPEDFYNRINQLFFESLNTPLNERENIPKKYELIPFLNGDLFRKKPVDEKGFKIRKESFIEAINFLRTFHFKKEFEDSANYIIDNTINPEILGHILEKTIENRKESGVYYTPQIITDYMAKEIIGKFIKKKVIEFLKKKNDPQFKYIENFEDIFELERIILKKIYSEIIKEIKICDPAAGSGAFLLSCGNLLFKIRQRILESLKTSYKNYDIKKEIIQDNLYGVDIKEAAVDICKLRLWLWIVQKHEQEPLPNIEFNIRKGNSLIGYTNTETIKIDIQDISSWVKKANLMDLFLNRNNLIRKYYTIEKPSEQKRLREDIDIITIEFNKKLNEAFLNDLRKEKINTDYEELASTSIFHWIFEFSDVFEKKKGFDIIIGNPPYFRITFAPKLEQKIIGKLGILKNYHHGQGDIYYDFIVRSYELLREGGHFAFITSRYWLESAYANYLKKFLKEKVKLTKIIDFREQLIFKGVDIHNSIISYIKELPIRVNKLFEVFLFEEAFDKEFKSLEITDYLEKVGNIDLESWNSNENWAFITKKYNDVFLKIKSIKTTLGEDYNCNQYTNSFRKKYKPYLIFEEKPHNIPGKFLRKYRKMGEINKFIVNSSINKYVIVVHNREEAWNDINLNKHLQINNFSKRDLIEIKNESDKNVDKYQEIVYIGYRIPMITYSFV